MSRIPASLSEKAARLGTEKSLSELLPWMLLLTENTVLNKDGSMLGVFEFAGVDAEGTADEVKERDANAVRRLFDTVCDGRSMFWWTVIREPAPPYPAGKFANEIAGKLDAEYQAAFAARPGFVNRRFLTVLLAAENPTSRALGRAAREGGVAWARELMRLAVNTLSGAGRFEADVVEITQQLEMHGSLCRAVVSALPQLELNRLSGPHLLGFLNRLASPTSPLQPVSVHPDAYLDEALGGDTLTVTRNALIFEGHSATRYVTALTVKPMPYAWPESTWPGVLDAVTDIAAEAVYTVAIRLLDPSESKAYVKGRRLHHLNMRKGIGGHLKEGVTHVETEQVDAGSQQLADSAGQAMADLSTAPGAGWLLVSLLIAAHTEDQLERHVEAAGRALTQAGCIVLRERMHLVGAWAGSFPGQWSEPVRWAFAGGASLADLSPFRGDSTGPAINKHLSEKAGVKLPALAAFASRTLTPCYVGPHQGDVGHGLILGRTGAGKTILGNFFALEWNKYPDAQVVIFDKDRSARILTELLGGRALDLDHGLRVNPLGGIETENDWRWLAGWVSRLLSQPGETLPAVDDNAIVEACVRLRALGVQRIAALAALLPGHLAERLSPWIGAGRWAAYFDHEEDGLALDGRVAIEMNALLREPRAARAFMDLAFRRVERGLTGRPTFLYVAEAWFMLQDERFAGQVNDWLRTLRKRNGVFMMDTQSPDELVASAAWAAISANIPNLFFAANEKVAENSAIYREKLGLNDRQIDLIKSLTPKSEYLYIAGGRTRLLAPRFPARVIAALRSDAKAQERFDVWKQSGKPGWERLYVDEMSKGQ